MAKINGVYEGDYVEVAEPVTGLARLIATNHDYDSEVAVSVILDRDGLVRLACAALQAVEALDVAK